MAFRLLWAVTAQTCLASDDLDGFEQPSGGFLPSEEGRGSGEDVPLLHTLRASAGCGRCCPVHRDEGSSPRCPLWKEVTTHSRPLRVGPEGPALRAQTIHIHFGNSSAGNLSLLLTYSSVVHFHHQDPAALRVVAQIVPARAGGSCCIREAFGFPAALLSGPAGSSGRLSLLGASVPPELGRSV